LRRHSMRRRDQCAALVVGHYCHDRLTLHGGRVVESLGGSVSYITNVFEALGMECRVMNLYSVYLHSVNVDSVQILWNLHVYTENRNP
jgi:hypothetical protein